MSKEDKYLDDVEQDTWEQFDASFPRENVLNPVEGEKIHGVVAPASPAGGPRFKDQTGSSATDNCSDAPNTHRRGVVASCGAPPRFKDIIVGQNDSKDTSTPSANHTGNGPEFKDQVRPIPHNRNVQRSQLGAWTSIRTQSLEPVQQIHPDRDPSLIYAVLVDDNVIVEADPVTDEEPVAQKSHCQRKLKLAILVSAIALAFAGGIVGGVCGVLGLCKESSPPSDTLTSPSTSSPSVEANASVSLCPILLSVECFLTDSNMGCARTPTPLVDSGIEPCLFTPSSLLILFNGGSCEQSDNTQLLNFTCVDMNGGPPIDLDDEAHIHVTDAANASLVLFDGIVPVGGLFNASAFEGEPLDKVSITIRTPDQQQILQVVTFLMSCASSLELLNRFGACQVVGFANSQQGTITAFEEINFSLDIEIPLTILAREQITILSLVVESNFFGRVNLTEYVTLENALPDTPTLLVTIAGIVDGSARTTYELFYSVEALISGNELCRISGSDFFEAGGF